MDNQTFRSRLVELIQKSRKAMRLYTSMGRTFIRPGDVRASAEFADIQAAEWRGVNSDLVRSLTAVIEAPHTKKLASDVVALRDRLHDSYRETEAEVRTKQRDLISASENSDFVKAAVLGKELVLLKARTQATQAAYHELDTVVKRCKVSCDHRASHTAIDSSGEKDVKIENPIPITRPAKVIPLRKTGL